VKFLLPYFLSAAVAAAAPITLKEIEFHLRQQVSEAEIAREAAQRHLLIPLDADSERLLRQSGASDTLITALKQPGVALSTEAAQMEAQRQQQQQMRTAQIAAQDSADYARRLQQQQQISASMRRVGTVRQMLEDKLVKMDGSNLRPFSAQGLEGVHIFVFFYAAFWDASSRKWAPTMVEAYRKLKEQYPTQFEVIFVSADRDEYNMGEFMRSQQMPWPAVRYGAVDSAIKQFGGETYPWLVAVAETGQPLTKNGMDKKFLPPEQVMSGVEQLLGMMKR